MVGHEVVVNGKKYHMCCWGAEPHKVVNSSTGVGVSLEIQVLDVETNQYLEWKEIKSNPYLMEKFSEFSKNAFNGQHTFYWDWNKIKNAMEVEEECSNVVDVKQE